MGCESSFIKGFEKRANAVVDMIKRVRKPLMVGAGVAGVGYGAGKFIQKTEDPEQAQLRSLRKMKALPYQGAQ